MLKFDGIWVILAWIYLKIEDLKDKINEIFTKIRYRRIRRK